MCGIALPEHSANLILFESMRPNSHGFVKKCARIPIKNAINTQRFSDQPRLESKHMSIPSRNLRPDLGVDSKAAPLGRGQTVAPSQMDGRGPAMPRLLRLTDQTQTQGRGERKNVIEGEESKRWPAAPRWTTLGRRGSAAPRRVSGRAVATGCHGTLRSRTRRRRARAAPRLESGRRWTCEGENRSGLPVSIETKKKPLDEITTRDSENCARNSVLLAT